MSNTLTPVTGITGPIRIFTATRQQLDTLIGSAPFERGVVREPFTGVITGSPGNDVIVSYSSAATVLGADGDDVIVSVPYIESRWLFGASDVIFGGNGDDVLWGYSTTRELNGDAGNDVIIAASGATTMTGGSGHDRVYSTVVQGTNLWDVQAALVLPNRLTGVEELVYIDSGLPSIAAMTMLNRTPVNLSSQSRATFYFSFVDAPISGIDLPGQVSTDAAFRAAFRQAAAEFEDLANIRFLEAGSVGEASFLVGRHSMSGAGYATVSSGPGVRTSGAPALLMINSSTDTASLMEGNAGYSTMLQQLGRVLGLTSPIENQVRVDLADGLTGFLSQMSNGIGRSNTGLMPMDIDAVRFLYGTTGSVQINREDNVYRLTQTDTFFPALVDDAGMDTLDVSGVRGSHVVDLSGGRFSWIGFDLTMLRAQFGEQALWSIGNLGITEKTVIERLVLGHGNDIGRGNAASNVISGREGNDLLEGRGGSDTVDGGTGTDTAVFSGRRSEYAISRNGPYVLVEHLNNGADGTDSLTQIEFIRFADQTIDIRPSGFFVAYSAFNPDLTREFGEDHGRLLQHFTNYGRADGRQAAGFSAEAYAALNPDLYRVFGLDNATLIQHFQTWGRHEGRATQGFSAEAYAARNPDLFALYGFDAARLVEHFQGWGRAEGRAASGFSVQAYAANNPDLYAAFGLDARALIRHYIEYGRAEGRTTTGFDAGTYAALNQDVLSPLGGDTDALVRHYIQTGRRDGRPATLEPVGQGMSAELEVIGSPSTGDGWT